MSYDDEEPRPNRLEWLVEANKIGSDNCLSPPFKLQSIRYLRAVRSMPWVACCLINGEPADHIMVPVRRCSTVGCCNGRHYRWGLKRRMRSQGDENNNNAKLNWEKVRAIRAMNWIGPNTIDMVERRKSVSDEMGISLTTLNKVIRKKIWKEPEEGDEF